MRIENIEIRNCRLFRHAKLSDLPRLAIVVGANGSGKSTLFLTRERNRSPSFQTMLGGIERVASPSSFTKRQ